MEILQPEGPKKLKRSINDKMLAGVCGGIAQYSNIDPTIVRLIFAFATIFTAVFPGVLIYLILWIIVPKEDFIS
jgi:phage shock protein PspC (stress-responsive transcriptional regulator)